MAKVKEVSGEDIDFFGYGGPHMKSLGFSTIVETNPEDFPQK